MRAGVSEPFDFFLGEMRNGAPIRGMVIIADEAGVVTQFDAAHRGATPRSGDPEAYHAVWVVAARAAMTTARRFAAAGNRASAAYYQRLAKKIRDGEPE